LGLERPLPWKKEGILGGLKGIKELWLRKEGRKRGKLFGPN